MKLRSYQIVPSWMAALESLVDRFSFGPGRTHATGHKMWLSAKETSIEDLVHFAERPSLYQTGEDRKSAAILSAIVKRFDNGEEPGLAPGVNRLRRGVIERYARMAPGTSTGEDAGRHVMLLGVPILTTFLHLILCRMPEEDLYAVATDLPLNGPRSKVPCLAVRLGVTENYCVLHAAEIDKGTAIFDADREHEREMDALCAALRVVRPGEPSPAPSKPRLTLVK